VINVVGVQWDDGNRNSLLVEFPNNNKTLEDCCSIAKNVFTDTLTDLLNETGTSRQKEILPELLVVDNLSCEDFKTMLNSLYKVGLNSGDLITATTQAVNKFIRLDKVPTSMFSTVASIIKQAGASAYEAWIKCQGSSDLNMTDPNWRETIQRSSDNKFNTWDNILLASYKPLDKKQKRDEE
tara:strand:+ start:5413 stop:5958 length:546 start_codon:yes stop_codon:yes gene_type:complete